MRQRARDHHRKLPAMRAVPTPRPTTARSRRWDQRIKQQGHYPSAFALNYRPAGRSPQPASARSGRRSTPN